MASLARNIPEALRRMSAWVVWKYVREVDADGSVDWDKPPVNARTHALASSTNPATWSRFDHALEALQRGGYDGLGVCLAPRPLEEGEVDALVGVDLDKMRNPETGEVEPWALEVVRELDSYTEVSPSGTGLRIFCLGRLPKGRRKKAGFEMYEHGRYVTVTGQILDGARPAVEARSAALAALHARMFPPQPAGGASAPAGAPRTPSPLSDFEIVEQASAAANGEKFRRLWAGDHSEYGSPSEADLALVNELVFWVGPDAARVDELFRASGLFRSKWNNREDYRARTIAKALEGRTAFYSPQGDGHGRSKICISGSVRLVEPPWPEPPHKLAFHGLVGEIVHILGPASEADPVALAAQLLAGFGNIIGRSAHCVVEADRHYGNEFVVLVGRTAKGRKGVSWGRVQALLKAADPSWAEDRVQSGISSGEGVIWAVRDPITKMERVKERGKLVRYEEVEADPGVKDKRLFLLEPEFAVVLKRLEQQGNIVSPVLRQAWDSGELRTLTKNSPARATGAHISLVGHITIEELRRYLTATESANGFGNRPLWFCVQRSKFLPEGGTVDKKALEKAHKALCDAVAFARSQAEMKRDDEARALWRTAYKDLSADRPGLAGAMAGRAEAHVLRLSLLFALLDRSKLIRRPHLLAALTLWEYSERSIQYIFGDALGDALADNILQLLRATPGGLTRNELRDFFGRHQSSERMSQALALLQMQGLIRCERQDTSGRPAERWFATPATGGVRGLSALSTLIAQSEPVNNDTPQLKLINGPDCGEVSSTPEQGCAESAESAERSGDWFAENETYESTRTPWDEEAA
jgi:hypothetical protein